MAASKQNKSLSGKNASATAQVKFDRNAVIAATTALAVDALQVFDYARSDYKASEGERNAMLLDSMTTARTACGKDTGAYLGVIDAVFGNGVKGKANTPGTVKEALVKTVHNPDSMKSALSKARKVGRWLADPANTVLGTDGKPFPLDTLVGIIDGTHDASGKRIPKATAADTPTAEVTPKAIAQQLRAWVKAGLAFDIAAGFASALKASKDAEMASIGASMVDIAAELETATGK